MGMEGKGVGREEGEKEREWTGKEGREEKRMDRQGRESQKVREARERKARGKVEDRDRKESDTNKYTSRQEDGNLKMIHPLSTFQGLPLESTVSDNGKSRPSTPPPPKKEKKKLSRQVSIVSWPFVAADSLPH